MKVIKITTQVPTSNGMRIVTIEYGPGAQYIAVQLGYSSDSGTWAYTLLRFQKMANAVTELWHGRYLTEAAATKLYKSINTNLLITIIP